LQRELEISRLQAFLRALGSGGSPVAAVPQLHGPAAVLALRNRALEVPVIEGMVFDFDREALITGIN
jgi:hypothetical protein